MKTLPHDESRCSGRFSFHESDDERCAERFTCQRYLAWIRWDAEAGISDYQGTPVSMGRANCQIKIKTIEVVTDD